MQGTLRFAKLQQQKKAASPNQSVWVVGLHCSCGLPIRQLRKVYLHNNTQQDETPQSERLEHLYLICLKSRLPNNAMPSLLLCPNCASYTTIRHICQIGISHHLASGQISVQCDSLRVSSSRAARARAQSRRRSSHPPPPAGGSSPNPTAPWPRSAARDADQ